jgi:hypothetical protein
MRLHAVAVTEEPETSVPLEGQANSSNKSVACKGKPEIDTLHPNV